jgi:RNA polymerase sigma factor (sigma-70 family)
MLADNELLRGYWTDRSESAFAELVRRHAALVYAAALRQLNGDADLALDVTQIVFTDLARKAGSVFKHRSIAGWLYTSARFAAAKLARSEQRRQTREQEAFAMNSPDIMPEPAPARLRLVIEDAMHELDEDDREAVLLRYFEGRDFKSVGSCLGISDAAARKRVIRAIERLRGVLEQRGISSSESALAAALSGAAALTIPGDLHASILSSALAASVQATPPITSTLFQVTPMKTALLLTGLVVGLGTATLLQRSSAARLRAENESLAQKVAALGMRSAGGQVPAGENPLDEELRRLRKEHSELLRLRDEVTRLRAAQRKPNLPQEPNSATDEQLLRNQQVSMEAKFLEAPASALKKIGLDAIGVDITGVGVTAILTEPQLKTLLHAFEQMPGMDLLAMPNVTTLHDRAASINIGETDSADVGGVKLGPALDLIPVLSTDRLTVTLQATASLAEPVTVVDDTGSEIKQVRQTAVSGNGVLRDGQTLVLSQRLGRSEVGGVTPGDNSSYLIVLVTPTLIDPAGNRLHASEESSEVSRTAEAVAPVEAVEPIPVEGVSGNGLLEVDSMVRAAVGQIEMGKYEAADKLLEAALAIEPNNSKARYYLGVVKDVHHSK